MMDRAALLLRITALFRELFPLFEGRVQEGLPLTNVEGLDSFAHVRLMLALERTFSVKFSAEEAVSLLTIGDIVNKIEEKQ